MARGGARSSRLNQRANTNKSTPAARRSTTDTVQPAKGVQTRSMASEALITTSSTAADQASTTAQPSLGMSTHSMRTRSMARKSQQQQTPLTAATTTSTQDSTAEDDTQEIPATERALDTYELLEQILLHLPIGELYINQRVSKTWRTVINRSLSLKRRMWRISEGAPIAALDLEEGSSHRFVLYQTPTFKICPFVNIDLADKTSIKAKVNGCTAFTARLSAVRGYLTIPGQNRPFMSVAFELDFFTAPEDPEDWWFDTPFTKPSFSHLLMTIGERGKEGFEEKVLYIKEEGQGFTLAHVWSANETFKEELEEKGRTVSSDQIKGHFQVEIPIHSSKAPPNKADLQKNLREHAEAFLDAED